MKQPLRRQILLPLIALTTAAVVINATAAAWINASRQHQLLQQRHREIVSVLERSTFPLTPTIVNHLAKLTGYEFLIWQPSSATPSLTSRSFSAEAETAIQSLFETRAQNPPASLIEADRLDRHVLDGESYVMTFIERAGSVNDRIAVMQSTKGIDAATRQAIFAPVMVGLVTLAVMIPILMTLAHGWSRRISEIQSAVADIAEGHLDRTAPLVSAADDELAALVMGINQMSAKLGVQRKQLIESERERLIAQVTAGFAHQLRNGLSGASLALQLHLSRCPCGTGDRSLTIAQQQLQLLSEELRSWLSLGQINQRSSEPVDLVKLVKEVAELISPHAEHRGTTLDLSALDPANINSSKFKLTSTEDPTRSHPDFTVNGHRDALRGAILNLALNGLEAVSPTSTSAQVGFRIVEREAELVIQVFDSGPGPSAEISARLGEPFLTSKPEGIGLGLTVVRAVANDHHGRLNWFRENNQTVFELVLPRNR